MARSPYDPNEDQTPDGQTDSGAPEVTSPQPYTPPRTETQTATPQLQTQSGQSSTDYAPPQTFAQMQAAGYARPPMPEPHAETSYNPSTQGQATAPTSPSLYSPVQAPSGPAFDVGYDAPPMQGDVSNVATTGTTGTTSTAALPTTYDPNVGYGSLGLSSPGGVAGTGTVETSGMTDQQQAEFLAQKYGPAFGQLTKAFSTPTGTAASGAGTVATYTPQSQASIAAASNDPTMQAIAAKNKAAIAQEQGTANTSTQNFDTQQNLDAWRQYANALNNQPGYTGPKLDPNTPSDWFLNGNPDAKAGFPTLYDPKKAVGPNNGAYDPATNSYVTPQTAATTTTGTAQTGGTTTPSPAASEPHAPALNPNVQGQATAPTAPTGTPTNPTLTANTNTTPGTFDLLKSLTEGASGQGPGSDVQKATQANTLDFLKNPNPYGSQDVKDTYSWLGGNIDDEYAREQQSLGEEMARRGLGFSTNYGGRLQDLNIGKRSAKEALGTDLAHQYATTYGQNQLGAINAGNTVGSTAQQNNQSWLGQLMGYGQQGFNNDVTTNALNQNAANSYQDYILKLLGLGYGGAAA